MPSITRSDDLGHGYCYAGHPDVPKGSPKEFITAFIGGAQTVFLNNKPLVIAGTLGETDCGHTTTAISGSGTIFVENQPVHRLGDIGVINEGDGEYEVITTSENVDAGD